MSKVQSIIEAWIGEIKEFTPIDPLKIYANPKDIAFIEGRNQAISDIKSRIPELEKEIVGEIEKTMPNAWFPQGALHMKKRFLEDLITLLTTPKTPDIDD